MNPARYTKARDASQAIEAALAEPGAHYIAGGTNIVDLMKDDVERPSLLIDITGLPLRGIGATAAGGVRIGALATMADVADAPLVKAGFPAVSQALLASASPQLRNMATIGGNVLQRTRCAYFRDPSQACNKRKPGKGCAAIGGQNRLHAVIGTSDDCICSHASDLAVALLAVDALVHTLGSAGRRAIPAADFWVLPGNRPDIETVLRPGELVEAIELPPSAHARASTYLKIRERASYEFALVSVATALHVDGGTIRTARIALGGIAPKPWRAYAVEEALVGKPALPATFALAAEIATHGMRGQGQNDFKIPLTRQALGAAFAGAGAAA